MKYCGIERMSAPLASADARNFYNPNNEPYQSLGERIRSAVEYGSDLGSPAVVQYDPDDSDDIDVLTDPNHDIFDIAESFQQDLTPATPVADAPKGDSRDGVKE